MKLVTAVVGPHAVGEVQAALVAFGVTVVTISDVAGPDNGRYGTYRGTRFAVKAPSKRLEVHCDVFDAEDVAGVIATAASRSGAAEAIVWISEVDRIVPVHAPVAVSAVH